MGDVIPIRPEKQDYSAPVTNIDGVPVRTYRVLIRDPATGTERHESWAALEDLSAVEMCQENLTWDAEDSGGPAEIAVSAVDVGPGEL